MPVFGFLSNCFCKGMCVKSSNIKQYSSFSSWIRDYFECVDCEMNTCGWVLLRKRQLYLLPLDMRSSEGFFSFTLAWRWSSSYFSIQILKGWKCFRCLTGKVELHSTASCQHMHTSQGSNHCPTGSICLFKDDSTGWNLALWKVLGNQGKWQLMKPLGKHSLLVEWVPQHNALLLFLLVLPE